MSLALGLVGKQSIALAADSYGHSLDAGGMYGYHFSKLILVNKDRWILGIAGSDSSRSLAGELERKSFGFEGQQIDDAIFRYSQEMESIYRTRCYRGDCYFLLAAFDDKTPCLYRWEFSDHGTSQLSKRLEVHTAAIGARYHGALYFSHAYHSVDLSDEALALLAHFCVSEASNQDPRIDKPIDVGVVPLDGARILPTEEMSPIEKASSAIASQIGEILRQHSLKLPHLTVQQQSKRDMQS